MEKSTFLLELAINDINSKFTKAGWVDIFRAGDYYSGGVYCYLVADTHLREHLKTREKAVWKGSEGRPTVSTFDLPNGEVSRYASFGIEGIEPFLYSKYFPFVKEKYIDVSEEFVNYFRLYEKGTKKDRTYYFFDEVGDMEEVLVITPERARVKQRFLMEYISVRRMHFAICFDFMVVANVSLTEMGAELQDEDYVSDSGNYNHLIRFCPGSTDLQSWITGKVVIKYDPKKTQKTWYDNDYEYEEFIIGYDNEGELLSVRCDSDEHQFFRPVYFKKEVLAKYYNDPAKYHVDGFEITCTAFSLKMDNNHDDYVVVFLNYLRMLPQKEQLYWKHYNIAPQPDMGISGSYYDTMVMGSWSRKSDALDVRFKQEYKSFNKSWFDKFGWHFYKEPSGTDVHLFNGLHLPADNSVRSFCDQMLLVVKFTIDSLNEQMLAKELPKIENEKGISKFERFMKTHATDIPDLFVFLKHLQNLRSGMIAHKFSEKNKSCQQAMEYFAMTADNYRDVAINIMGKSLWTLNTLSHLFIKNSGDLD